MTVARQRRTDVAGRLEALAEAAAGCRNCDLWRDATQTVFGEGRTDAPMMLIGEQPGDQEDLAGRPFVGPAGRLLDEALADAGIDRDAVYVTNAVKHFKWKARGKRRIHQKPTWGEIEACRPWLDGELEAVRPDVLVLLGATAAPDAARPQLPRDAEPRRGDRRHRSRACRRRDAAPVGRAPRAGRRGAPRSARAARRRPSLRRDASVTHRQRGDARFGDRCDGRGRRHGESSTHRQ